MHNLHSPNILQPEVQEGRTPTPRHVERRPHVPGVHLRHVRRVERQTDIAAVKVEVPRPHIPAVGPCRVRRADLWRVERQTDVAAVKVEVPRPHIPAVGHCRVRRADLWRVNAKLT